MLQFAKFHDDWSSRCEDMAIFAIWQQSAILDSSDAHLNKPQKVIVMQNLVRIDAVVLIT